MTKRIVKSKLVFIVIFIGFISTAVTAQGAGRSAILVGINQYTHESQIPPLRFAVSDAQKLSDILSQNGYECRIMIDKDATKEQLTEAFIQIEQQTGQTSELDVFLFYFSGRGARIPDDIQADETQDGLDECILPSDAVVDNPRSYIRDDALAHWISAIRAKRVIIVPDCAFWGDEANAAVKGFGKQPEAVALDGIEVADGLPPNVVVLAAALPDARAEDGVFTAKLLEACVTEGADMDGDRVISFAEAYQHARRQLQGQPPRLVGDANILLAPLPPLSRLQIESNPAGAEIRVYSGSEQIPLDGPQYTPVAVPLKQGTYRVWVQKPGFLIPEAKEVAIKEYNALYIVDPFKLKAVAVVGRASIINKSGEPIPIEGTALVLHVKQAGKEIYQEVLPTDGRFRFEPAVHQWLEVGAEYEINATGQPVLDVKPARFVYDGYSDIRADMTVTLDVVPPALSPGGITFQSTRLVVGEELRGSVVAQDDGLGLADTIEVQLQPPGSQEPISVPASQISFQSPGTYQFRYAAAAGEWSVASLTLQDKAGNKTNYSAEQLNVAFLVFPDRFALGRYYFDAEDYTEALAQFKQVSPLSDDARYLIALAYYQQKDTNKVLAEFQTIETKTDYLGRDRRKEMPQMPRQLVSKLWGKLLDDLKDHKTDAAYMSLLAATAEELGRVYEAGVYRAYARDLISTAE